MSITRIIYTGTCVRLMHGVFLSTQITFEGQFIKTLGAYHNFRNDVEADGVRAEDPGELSAYTTVEHWGLIALTRGDTF